MLIIMIHASQCLEDIGACTQVASLGHTQGRLMQYVHI